MTVVDFLRSAAKDMSTIIKPDRAVVVEYYGGLGLERTLRRYELIWDVVNSWDYERHERLIIVNSRSAGDDKDLDISSISRSVKAPNGFLLQLYHSKQLGKWNKRYITLLESGRIFSSKKLDAKPWDKDNVVCDLSNFDIYTPTETQTKRYLKPPKRYCYAIRSQERASFFADKDDFVQYFCTDDIKVARQFFARVHAWRSWYLVNRNNGRDYGGNTVVRPLPKTRVPKPPPPLQPPPPPPKTDVLPPRMTTTRNRPQESVDVATTAYGRGQRVSVDGSPPVLNVDLSEGSMGDFSKDFLPDEDDGAGKVEVEAKTESPTASGGLLVPDFRTVPSGGSDKQRSPRATADAAAVRTPTVVRRRTDASQRSVSPITLFAADDLLGTSFDSRQRQQRTATSRASCDTASTSLDDRSAGPFIDGPNLLNTAMKRREPTPWLPSAVEHTARRRQAEEAARATARRAASQRRHREFLWRLQQERDQRLQQERDQRLQQQQQQQKRDQQQRLKRGQRLQQQQERDRRLQQQQERDQQLRQRRERDQWPQQQQERDQRLPEQQELVQRLQQQQERSQWLQQQKQYQQEEKGQISRYYDNNWPGPARRPVSSHGPAGGSGASRRPPSIVSLPSRAYHNRQNSSHDSSIWGGTGSEIRQHDSRREQPREIEPPVLLVDLARNKHDWKYQGGYGVGPGPYPKMMAPWRPRSNSAAGTMTGGGPSPYPETMPPRRPRSNSVTGTMTGGGSGFGPAVNGEVGGVPLIQRLPSDPFGTSGRESRRHPRSRYTS